MVFPAPAVDVPPQPWTGRFDGDGPEHRRWWQAVTPYTRPRVQPASAQPAPVQPAPAERPIRHSTPAEQRVQQVGHPINRIHAQFGP